MRILDLDPETRIRLRNWIGSSFDGCGLQRVSDSETSDIKTFFASDFERTNMREYQVRGRLHDRVAASDFGGIYAIASDRDWLYVGQAKSLAKRRSQHASTLRNGSHANALLQRHWNARADPMWFVILDRWCDNMDVRRGIEHPDELKWKRVLRPLYDREVRKADVSLLIHPSQYFDDDRSEIQPVNGAPSWTWAGGPPTLPRSTSKSCGRPS
jgi:hypothetical protein